MDVAIGGGICGLSLALNLKERGVACRVYERAPEIRELGVGITLLPHAMREFSALGLGDALLNWLDVAQLIRDADQILEHPMVDKDPIDRWTFGRVTLAGDAAHPMYPRGSNGAAQAAIDARTLTDRSASTFAYLRFRRALALAKAYTGATAVLVDKFDACTYEGLKD